MQRPNFYRKYATPNFLQQFLVSFELRDAWLKDSLVLQHILYHHPKNLTLLAQKNGNYNLTDQHLHISTFPKGFFHSKYHWM